MTGKANLIAEEAAQLDRQERVAIIEKLLESLEPAAAEDPSEVQAAWSRETRQRSKELRDGDVSSVPWDQVKAEGEKLFDGD